MDLFSLILYGAVNTAMVFCYLPGKGRFYQFPFWAGVMSLGWFFPQAIGGYLSKTKYPDNSYAEGVLFATLCILALWTGFTLAANRKVSRPSWLAASLYNQRLYWAGAALCLFGFYFQYKLSTLPDEFTSMGIWSGPAVKYLFFANAFKIGFLTLWLLYLSQPNVRSTKLLVFIVPSLLLMLSAIIMRGRRGEMMNLAAYLMITVWLVRRISIPRWTVVSGLIAGFILVNSIATYRSIMAREEDTMKERVQSLLSADYLISLAKVMDESGFEFTNYIIYRKACSVKGQYDYGAAHWNKFIFNYVPAQVFGREFKESLQLRSVMEIDSKAAAQELYGHKWKPGTTSTGYMDAFASFGWFGFIKFLIIGSMMGVLFRHAMNGAFLGQLLYVYALTAAMQAITHGTNGILVRIWVYFFAFAYPLLYWAKVRRPKNVDTSPAGASSGIAR